MPDKRLLRGEPFELSDDVKGVFLKTATGTSSIRDFILFVNHEGRKKVAELNSMEYRQLNPFDDPDYVGNKDYEGLLRMQSLLKEDVYGFKDEIRDLEGQIEEAEYSLSETENKLKEVEKLISKEVPCLA